jgi:hypothetical protein
MIIDEVSGGVGLLGILSGEWYKIKNSTKEKIILSLSPIIVLFYCVYIICYKQPANQEAFLQLVRAKVNILIVIFALFNFILQEEFSCNTMKNIYCIIGSKWKIFCSKVIVQSTLVVGIFAIDCFLVYIISAIYYGNQDGALSLFLMQFQGGIVLVWRAMIVLDLLTIILKNDYFVFLGYIIYLQFSKHFMLLIESVFAIPVKISGFSFQNQMVRLMNYINDSLELVTFLIDNALIALLCLCICIVISRYSKVSS